jgi:hypothetical protein
MKFSRAAWEVAINPLAEGKGRQDFSRRAVRHLLQSSSASRFTAAQAGFFTLSQLPRGSSLPPPALRERIRLRTDLMRENQSDHYKKCTDYADQNERCKNMPSAAIWMRIPVQTESLSLMRRKKRRRLPLRRACEADLGHIGTKRLFRLPLFQQRP